MAVALPIMRPLILFIGSPELLGLAVIRWKFFQTSFTRSLLHLVLGGAIIAIVGATLGASA